MMPQPKGRAIEELYNTTEFILKPRITPVVRGSYRMQGPVDETDYDNAQRNMVSSRSENTSGKCSMKRQVLLRVESGACNVCSAPCSSCMHFNRAFMGSKADEFSDETSLVNMTSQNSANVGDVSSSCKRRACDSVQNTTSETSNLISVNSNHGSLSENADSKESPRSADITDALEVEMQPKLSFVKNAEWVEQYPKTSARSNRYEDSRGAHDDDDNISCISRGNDAHVADSNLSRNVDKKNLSCSSFSVSSLNKEYDRRAHEPSSHIPSSNHTVSPSNSLKGKAPVKCPRGLVDKEPSPKEAATDDSCGQKSGSHKRSDIFLKTYLNPEAETINDERKPTEEAFMCEQDRKSSEYNMQEPPNRSVSGDESDESDIVELDVKVCDICGEAGREDLLAICSRCSDGAEHIYCMQKMHKKVPRGNWLCEECKFSQGTNSQKQVAEIDGKSMNKASSSVRFSGKRPADNVEMAPAAKRQPRETSVVTPKFSSPAKALRESSFKNLDREKLRPMQQTSVGGHTTDTVETQPSATTIPQLQTLKGILSKSNSFNTFNSKPKVKLIDEVIPQKKKGAKEQTKLDMMGRPTRLLGKSLSFKSATIGRLNASDSKVKMLSPKELNHVLDSKGLKQPKERTAFERKALTKIDRPAVSSTPAGSSVSTPKVDHQCHLESSSTSSLSNNRDVKATQREGKPSNPSKLEGNIVRRPNISVGVSSINVTQSSATEQTLNHPNPKDESLSTYDLITEKSRNNVDGSSHDGLPQSLELAKQAKLTRDDIIPQRPTTMAVCPEVVVSHASEYGAIGGSQASDTDAFTTRISRDEMQCGSRLKDAIQAALLRKPELCRKKKVLEQSEEFSALNTEINCEATAQNHMLASIKLKSNSSSERSNEGEAILGSPTPESDMHSTDNNLMWHVVPATDGMFSSNIGESDVGFSSLGKPMLKDLLNLASATSSLVTKTSAIPEYEYIWQGYFEVHKSGNFLDLSGGIQAHLSTFASPKVLEIAEKFPQNLTLHEVPRLSTWPTQFQESGSTEDNIALYFFAKDNESYYRSYKGLVDGMIKNDTALKGQFEGVELLIFSSNQLPMKSMRWNMLFYLWGVFRARRVHNSDSSTELRFPNLSSMSVEKHPLSAVMTLSDSLCSPERVHKKSPASFFDEANEIAIANCKDKKPHTEHSLASSNANIVMQDGRLLSESTCRASLGEEIRGTSPSLEKNILPNNRLGVEFKSPFLSTATESFNKGEKMKLHCNTCDRKDTLSLNILPVSNQEVGVAGSVREKKISNARVGDESNLDGLDHYKAKAEMKEEDGYLNTAAWPVSGLNSQGHNSCQSDHRKRSYIEFSDSAPSASRGTHQTMLWNGGSNVLLTIDKKPKTGLSNIYGCSGISSGLTSDGDGIASRLTALGPCSLEREKCVDTSEEKVIMEDARSSEEYFFPTNSCHKSGYNSMLRESFSAGEDHLNDGFPNLELALGVDTKPQNTGMLPFFVGLADKSDTEDKPPNKVLDDKEDDASASLSLSLSFPFPDKEETAKSISKSEQLRPERRHSDTSLLLFGDLSEK